MKYCLLFFMVDPTEPGVFFVGSFYVQASNQSGILSAGLICYLVQVTGSGSVLKTSQTGEPGIKLRDP